MDNQPQSSLLGDSTDVDQFQQQLEEQNKEIARTEADIRAALIQFSKEDYSKPFFQWMKKLAILRVYTKGKSLEECANVDGIRFLAMEVLRLSETQL